MEKMEILKALLTECDGLIIGAGAGASVECGLPDYRGEAGFWRAYPELKKAGLSYNETAGAGIFQSNPKLAWGFYGHRINLYRKARIHEGYLNLLKALKETEIPNFVWTSNVDEMFLRAGWSEESILECHGSLMWAQCSENCGSGVWPMEKIEFKITDRMMLDGKIPHCPECGKPARPNVMAFGDRFWNAHRLYRQEDRYREFRKKYKNLVCIEIGAGDDIPSVRRACLSAGRVVRINLENGEGEVSLWMQGGAKDGMNKLSSILREERRVCFNNQNILNNIVE